MTMAVVVPARMIKNRVKTDAFERNSVSDGNLRLPANVSEPVGALAVFDPGFGNQNRTIITPVIFTQNFVKRSIKRVPAFDFAAVRVKPLIVKIIVQPDDVEIFGRAAE